MTIEVRVGNETLTFKSPWQAVVAVAFKVCAIKGGERGIEPELVEKVKKIVNIAAEYAPDTTVKSRGGEYNPKELVDRLKAAVNELFSDRMQELWSAIEGAIGKGFSVLALRMICTKAVLKGVLLPYYKEKNIDRIIDFVRRLREAGVINEQTASVIEDILSQVREVVKVKA